MTAASMNLFLKELFTNSSDYKLLTQRTINAAYVERMQLHSLREDDRRLLKEMTEIMFNKMMDIDGNNESDSDGGCPAVNKSKRTNCISDSEDMILENIPDSNQKIPKISKIIDTSDNDSNNGKPQIKNMDDAINSNDKSIKNVDTDNLSHNISDTNQNPQNIKTDNISWLIDKSPKDVDANNIIDSDIDSNISDAEANKPSLDIYKRSSNNGESSGDDKNDRIVIPNKNKRKSRSPSPSSISQSDSNGPPSPPTLINLKKKKARKRKRKDAAGGEVGLMMLAADDSSDEEITINQLKSKIHSDAKDLLHNKKKNQNEKKEVKSTQSKEKAPEKSQRLKHIEKIARTSGILPVGLKYTKTFGECKNEEDRITVIKKLLRDAGMTGPISMEKAEVIKLKKEAAELNTDNILHSNGRGVRNVHSIFSRHQKQSEPVDRPPLKNKLQNLRDIIHSDSDS